MSSTTVALSDRPSLRAGLRLALLLFVSTVSIGVFVLLHKGVVLPFPTFRGACQRLQASGLAISERDWFCLPTPWTARAGSVAASLLAAAGFALPCAILAATGRRISAFAPLLALAFTTYPTLLFDGPRWWQGTWPVGPVAAAAVTALLVALPATVVAAARRTRVAARPRVSLLGGSAAAVICALAVIPLRYVSDAMFGGHFASIGAAFSSVSLLWPAVAMALFAAMLGPDRRWWPWSLAPTALLLSFAPSLALIAYPEGWRDWSMFGAVLPLFLVGMIWSAWRPLATRLTRRIDRVPPRDGEDVGTSPTAPERRRSAAARDAFALGLLGISLVAFFADPLPSQVGTSLPTYLGERTAIQDVRAKTNLRMAIDAMDRYRLESGSYRGFGPDVGASIEPRLAWTERRADATTPLWTWVVAAKGEVARVASLSSSGNAFCLERSTEGLTYGTASGELGSLPADRVLRAAVSACGRTAWSGAAIRRPRYETMCDGLGRSGGYLLCRMVQVVNVMELRQTKPDGA